MPTSILLSKNGLNATITTDVLMSRADERSPNDHTLGVLYAGVEALEAAIQAHVTDPQKLDEQIADLQAKKAAIESGEAKASVAVAE